MEWPLRKRVELSFSYIEVNGAFLGEDVILCVQGGDRPHIGCTVQAVPRPSLTGDGTAGATSSVINLTGHKDEMICRRLAEALCRALKTVVVCSGGFHMDRITGTQIAEVTEAVETIAKEWEGRGKYDEI